MDVYIFFENGHCYKTFRPGQGLPLGFRLGQTIYSLQHDMMTYEQASEYAKCELYTKKNTFTTSLPTLKEAEKLRANLSSVKQMLELIPKEYRPKKFDNSVFWLNAKAVTDYYWCYSVHTGKKTTRFILSHADALFILKPKPEPEED